MTLIASDQMATAFQTLLASGNVNNYDWVAPMNPDLKQLIRLAEQGRMAALNKAVEQYSDGRARDYFFTDNGTSFLAGNGTGKTAFNLGKLPDGNVYWLGQYWSSRYSPEQPIFWSGGPVLGNIRQDWLDKLGLRMPKNPDEFYNALVAFRENDANGNGVKDEVAVTNLGGFDSGIPQWFGIGTGLVNVIDGKAGSPWYSAHVKDYFAYMNTLYKAGVLSGTDDKQPKLQANLIGYHVDYATQRYVESIITIPAGAPVPYYNPVHFQVYPDTQALLNHGGGAYAMLTSTPFIPTSSKKVEKVVRLIDWLSTEESMLLAQFGIEGYSYEWVDDYPVWYGEEDKRGRTGFDALVIRSFDVVRGSTCILPPWGGAWTHNEVDTVVPNWAKTLGYDPATFRQGFIQDWLGGKFKRFSPSLDNYLPYPTVAELERQAQITPDLNTYASELHTALVLGTKSLDNWDSYIADLKRLGLDELIQGYQSRADKAPPIVFPNLEQGR
jgi:hypothetical protein